jgi:hypothetical protein
MTRPRTLILAGLMAMMATAGQAQEAWTVKPAWVSAHENFLASSALRGRGSATHDEVVAATYVASVFESYGLSPAPGLDSYLQTVPLVATTRGETVQLTVASSEAAPHPGPATVAEVATTNAIGWLQGSDPDAGVVMISAHLDHLGIRNGVLYPGANDNASGTTAVLELAHALAGGEQPRRSILFVAYGSEELGMLGSKYFAEHPPIPLETIVANLEIEMIGQQDPRMPAGVMMMTGFDRSDFGPQLKARGALIAPDLYPEQMFFQRSDNYPLALKGIVAHTISGWATIPTYHSPEDNLASLDIPFMTAAIQSLVEPLRALAAGEITPRWTADGRPVAGGR